MRIEVLEGNEQFILPGNLAYRVVIDDAEDSGTELNRAFVSLDYFESPDEVQQNLGHQELKVEELGQKLTQELDCKTCHKEKEASIGPNYHNIANKYKNQEGAGEYLMNRIAQGGSGVWGPVAMPAHPSLSQAELRQMVAYIRSLSAEELAEEDSLPLSGDLQINANKGYAVLKASYTDKGAEGLPALSNQAELVLRPAQMGADDVQDVKGFSTMVYNDTPMLLFPAQEGSFGLQGIDLTGVQSIRAVLAWQNELNKPVSLKLNHKVSSGESFLSQAELRPQEVKGQGIGTMEFKLDPLARKRNSSLQWSFNNSLGDQAIPVRAVILRLELIGE